MKTDSVSHSACTVMPLRRMTFSKDSMEGYATSVHITEKGEGRKRKRQSSGRKSKRQNCHWPVSDTSTETIPGAASLSHVTTEGSDGVFSDTHSWLDVLTCNTKLNDTQCRSLVYHTAVWSCCTSMYMSCIRYCESSSTSKLMTLICYVTFIP